MRPRVLAPAAVVAALITVCGHGQAQELHELMELMAGDFDNRRQYAAQFDETDAAMAEVEEKRSRAGASPSDGGDGEPLFSLLGLQRRIVDVPFLEGPVIYTQINRRSDPNDVYRQSLWVFRQGDDGVITTRVYNFRDREKFRDILQRPKAFAALTSEDVSAALPEACDPRWTYEDSLWVSRVDPRRCVVTSRRTGKPRHIQSTEYIEAGLIRNEESGYTPEGEMIFGLPDGVFYHYEKVEGRTTTLDGRSDTR